MSSRSSTRSNSPAFERNEPRPDFAGPSHVQASFTPDGKGGGVLVVQYTGPLTSYDPIWVRLGERREGTDWLQTRDVLMSRDGNRATARIILEAGAPIDGATFAFYTVIGRAGQEIWDNAGKPYGCYVLDTKTGVVSAH
jgi:hypothetical protein